MDEQSKAQNDELMVGASLNMIPPPQTVFARNHDDGLQAFSPVDNLFPALVDCFGIIFLGYIAGRFNFVSDTESKGLNTFVGTFALPALIFRTLCELDLTSVNWTFLSAILLAKATVFFSVMLITFLTTSDSRISKAGLYAIFTTQSNDFALGYPILMALYEKTSPEIPKYLYLLAPISLVILNPIGLILMEVGKVKSSNDRSFEQEEIIEERFPQSSQPNIGATQTSTFHRVFRIENRTLKTCLQIMKGVVTNPLIFMTVLGVICGTFIFPGQAEIPDTIDNFLKNLGNAFSATALFLLGLSMVGRMQSLKGRMWISPFILIIAKIFILPIFAREYASTLLNPSNQNATENRELSDFAFLYGTFPVAPTVFVYASKYNVVPDVIASAMVACTLMSAPMMFVSAQLLTITNIDPNEYISLLDNFLLNISVLALFATFFTSFVFLVSKNWRQMPHCQTLALVITQGIACTGAILWSVLDCTHGWRLYLQFSVFTFGVYGSRVYAATLALSLVCAVTYPSNYVEKLKPYFLVSGIIIPSFLVGVQLLTVQSETNPHGDKTDPNFQYGTTSVGVALSVLVITLLVIIVSLVITHRAEQSNPSGRNGYNEDERRLLESPTPEEVAEAMRSDTMHVNTVAEAADKLATTTMSAVENSKDNFGDGDIKDNKQVPDDITTTDSIVPTDELISFGESASSMNKADNINLENGLTNQVSTKDIEDTIIACKDNNTCSDCQNTGPVASNGIKRRRYRCDSENCRALLQRYDAPPAIDAATEETTQLHYLGYGHILNTWNKPEDPNEIVRHSILLLCLGLSMFVGIALCIWTLLMDEMTGIYVMLIFLDGFLNFGQGIFAFIIFGLQSGYVFLPLKSWYQKIIYGQDSLVLPPWEDVGDDTKAVCQQFLKHHINPCMDTLMRDVRTRFGSVLKGVFYGSDFVDWLLDVGLSQSRQDAVIYGRHLVTGRVMRHTENYLDFYDHKDFLYTLEPVSSRTP